MRRKECIYLFNCLYFLMRLRENLHWNSGFSVRAGLWEHNKRAKMSLIIFFLYLQNTYYVEKIMLIDMKETVELQHWIYLCHLLGKFKCKCLEKYDNVSAEKLGERWIWSDCFRLEEGIPLLRELHSVSSHPYVILISSCWSFSVSQESAVPHIEESCCFSFLTDSYED